MDIPILLEDLIKNFHQHKQLNKDEIKAAEELLENLNKTHWQRFFQNSLSYLLEILIWILAIACLGAIIFMEKLYPFSVLSVLKQHTNELETLGPKDLTKLIWTLRMVFLLSAGAFVWIAKLIARRRTHAKEIKEIAESIDELKKMMMLQEASFQTLNTKYPVDLSSKNADSIAPLNKPNKDEHNDILL